MNYNLRHTIGKISSYYGSFSILLRAYSYILKNGDNLKINTQRAVLNANYMANQLSGFYKIPYKNLKNTSLCFQQMVQAKRRWIYPNISLIWCSFTNNIFSINC